jgi:hypothetical protein
VCPTLSPFSILTVVGQQRKQKNNAKKRKEKKNKNK